MLACFLLSGTGHAATAEGAVSTVIDGITFRLVEGGSVRLLGVRPVAGSEALATGTLTTLIQGRRVRLQTAPDGRTVDRHGRGLAHVFLADGTWVQGAMLRRGAVIAYTTADNRFLAREMYEAEAQARKEAVGIWSNGDPVLQEARSVSGPAGFFRIVEGRITRTARGRGAVYLNFGSDGRSDFTGVIGREALRLFPGGEAGVRAMTGLTVRVRGWLERQRDGFAITVTHPEQVEIETSPPP
ncbi:MAG: thermonuclease family protein [Alphaproteobacteria bacterium]